MSLKYFYEINKERGKMTSQPYFTYDQAKLIGEQLGIKWDKFDVEQFRRGMDVELEHGEVKLS